METNTNALFTHHTCPATVNTEHQTAAKTSQEVEFKRHRPGLKHASCTLLYDQDQSPFFPLHRLDRWCAHNMSV